MVDQGVFEVVWCFFEVYEFGNDLFFYFVVVGDIVY